MTQTEIILQHLRDERRGSITSLEAVQSYGITRLAARIYDLRQEGYPIQGRTIDVENRRGETTQVTEYFLPAGQGELAL